MNTPGNKKTDDPHRRRSDLTLLGSSSQDLEDKIYTLEFGVNLGHITFEGLNTYSVTVTCFDKASDSTQSLTSVLEIHRQDQINAISIEGGPPYAFKVSDKTLDLSSDDLDQSIIYVVEQGISWLKGEIQDNWVTENRRKVPKELLNDRIAINLLMSSVSTIIGASLDCHRQVVKEKQHLFTSKQDYVDAMYEKLKEELDEFTVVAINRGVQHYVSSS